MDRPQTNAERSRAFKRRRAAEGIVQINVRVPERHRGAMLQLAEMLRDNPALELATLRDTVSGKLVGIK
jgi:hypothetical protein